MNSSLTRLMWKEYRAQRMLWTVLLSSSVLIQLIVAALSPGHDGSFVVVTVTVLCFAAASGAVLFAAEIEDRTEGLLRMLPCPTRELVVAKTTAMLLATMAMAISATFTHFLVGFVARSVMGPGNGGDGQEPIEAIEVYALLAGAVLVFGSAVLSSLLSRRVLYALGLTVVFGVSSVFMASLIAGWLLSSPVTDARYVMSVLAMVALSGALAGFVIFWGLSEPWHVGRLPRSFLPAAKIPVNAVVAPSSRLMESRRLMQISMWPASYGRVAAMLAWRELRFAVPFGFRWLLAGVVVCAGRYFTWSDSYPWPALLLVIFIHQCGGRTNVDDQRTGASLLLANIGVSPWQVWLTKTVCWFCIMLGVGSAFVAMDALAPESSGMDQSDSSRIHHVIDVIRAPQVPARIFASAPGNRFPTTVADRSLQIGVIMSFVLALFGSGHLMTCWIRRPLIAFAASILLMTVWLLVLIKFMSWNDGTVWIAIAPCALCLYAAAAVTSRSWLERTTGWRQRLQQIAWLVIPLIVFPSVAWIVWGWRL